MISDYNIQKEFTFHFIIRLIGDLQIFMNRIMIKIITIDVESSGTIENAKTKIQNKHNISSYQ